MRDLVEYIATNLVENPEAVRVEQTRGHQADMLVLRLIVPESERGKVIGREGRIAKAMRDLIRVGAARQGKRAILEIR